jgi:peptidoglycan/LPS O-acetylase OafA/YrhL
MKDGGHIQVLDGWRGLSISLVLLAHLIPLAGPKAMQIVASAINDYLPQLFQIQPQAWNLNDSVGILGMVIFFNLSGFLITSYLLKEGATVAEFLIRRIFRIFPLAWLYLAVVLPLYAPALGTWIANLLFYANLPPKQLLPLAEHFWSLCLEIQFYAGVAALFLFFRARGLIVLPLLCASVTLLRIHNGVYASSVTYFRIDEILAGCILALLFNGRLGAAGEGLLRAIGKIPQWILLVLLVASCLEQGGWLNYLRPYLAAALIGSTMASANTFLARNLQNRVLSYLAGISYALYVLHVGLTGSWLGSGETVERYLKRPLLLLVLFVLAHLSTNYYEHRWISLGRRLSAQLSRSRNGTRPSIP